MTDWERFRDSNSYREMMVPDNFVGDSSILATIEEFDCFKEARQHYKELLTQRAYKLLTDRFHSFKYRQRRQLKPIAVSGNTHVRLSRIKAKMNMNSESFDEVIEYLCDAKVELEPYVEAIKQEVSNEELPNPLSQEQKIRLLKDALGYNGEKVVTQLLLTLAREAFVAGRESQQRKRKLDLDECQDLPVIKKWLG